MFHTEVFSNKCQVVFRKIFCSEKDNFTLSKISVGKFTGHILETSL